MSTYFETVQKVSRHPSHSFRCFDNFSTRTRPKPSPNSRLSLLCRRVYQSFVDVPVTEEGVDTLQFLEATQGLIGIFGEFLPPSTLSLSRRLTHRLVERGIRSPR